MKANNSSGLVLCSIFATAAVIAVSCTQVPEAEIANSKTTNGTVVESTAAEESELENMDSSFGDGALELALPIPDQPAAIAANDFQPLKIQKSAPSPPAPKRAMAARELQPPVEVQQMAVMAPAEVIVEDVETDLPPSQTTMTVFYATDRKSKYGIEPTDWVKLHSWALIALAVYIVTFIAVFASSNKRFYGTVAFASLIVFLILGQNATVNWQKQKRLAANGDASYVSEIRSSHSDELLDYGSCKVTIPPNHKVGHLDSPSLFKLEFREDPEKHVVMHRVIQADKNQFYENLNQSISQSENQEALVFVHGYNVSFENAVKRTAQIVHDLKFDGAPICYSWASHGALANYTKDMANADATVVPLQKFLEETVKRTGSTTVHLVVHSMGNRALLQALDRIAVGSTRSSNKMFGQLVVAAPDVSANDFKNRYAPSAMELAESVTLYASSRDRALLVSTEFHGHKRAGLAGENLVVIDGLDTIDVSEIDTSLIGHSYYGDHPELIKDLRALVELSQPASKRTWLKRIINPGSADYFRFAEHETRSANDLEFKPKRR